MNIFPRINIKSCWSFSSTFRCCDIRVDFKRLFVFGIIATPFSLTVFRLILCSTKLNRINVCTGRGFPRHFLYEFSGKVSISTQRERERGVVVHSIRHFSTTTTTTIEGGIDIYIVYI